MGANQGLISLFQNLAEFDSEGDWDLFDTYEGYMWHRFQHLENRFKQFYLHEQAAKEFG